MGQHKDKKGSAASTKNDPKWWQNAAIVVPIIVALFGCISTVIVALLRPELITVVLNGFPTSSPAATSAPTDTATFFPPSATVDTPPGITPTLVETTPPTALPTDTPTPAALACPWRPYSTLESSITVGAGCLNDLLALGISGADPILFYKQSGFGVGVVGISRKIPSDSEFSITLKIRELDYIRFFVLLSQKEVGYQSSLGFRIIPEIKDRTHERYIQLVQFDQYGYDELESAIQELPLWSGNLTLTLKFHGSQVKAYVNDAFFGQSEITFNDRYLFIGYQSMANPATPPYIDVTVQDPQE